MANTAINASRASTNFFIILPPFFTYKKYILAQWDCQVIESPIGVYYLLAFVIQ